MERDPRDKRVPFMMSEAELQAVDDWRYENKIATRAEALRRLCQMGLIADLTSSRLTNVRIHVYEYLAAKHPKSFAETDDSRMLMSLNVMLAGATIFLNTAKKANRDIENTNSVVAFFDTLIKAMQGKTSMISAIEKLRMEYPDIFRDIK